MPNLYSSIIFCGIFILFLQDIIVESRAQNSSAFLAVRAYLNSLKPVHDASTNVPKRHREALGPVRPIPMQGQRKPFGRRALVDADTAPWPLPHPNWYKKAAQRKFKSSLQHRPNDGPLSYPTSPLYDYSVDVAKETAARAEMEAREAQEAQQKEQQLSADDKSLDTPEDTDRSPLML